MPNKKTALLLGVTLLPSLFGYTIMNVVTNGSFEDGFSEYGARPEYWYIGLPDERPIDGFGEWDFDSTIVADGLVSVHLVTDCPDTESYFLTQVVDAPTFDLEGKSVTFSLKMRVPVYGTAYALLIAFNPESPDTLFDVIPTVGYAILMPEPGDTGFVELCDSFTATGPAQLMAVLISVNGPANEAWFDDIRVTYDVADEHPGPDTSEVANPLGTSPREFYIGTTSEVTRNFSEAALEDLPSEIAEVGDMVNIFTHIKWNDLRDTTLLAGHDRPLFVSELAEDIGLARALTFDFTHDTPTTVGEINPMPDGTPVDSLSPEVREAYINELLALVDEIDPVIVIVGIETDIFFGVRPDQWDNYVLLMSEVTTALSSRPEIHITAYFCYDHMVSYDGFFNSELRDAWLEIMPYCESIGFSFYPDTNDISWFAPDYFTLAQSLDPTKPMIIPEFGCRSDTLQGFSEDIQLNIISTIVSQLASTSPPPVAIICYPMFDINYYGVPEWFTTAFATLGLRDYAGTPKKVHAAFRKMLVSGAKIEESGTRLPRLGITVWPNPFNSAVNIVARGVGATDRSPGQIARVEVFDITGRLVGNLPLSRTESCGDINYDKYFGQDSVREPTPLIWTPEESIPSGVYLIRVKAGAMTVRKKVVYLK